VLKTGYGASLPTWGKVFVLAA